MFHMNESKETSLIRTIVIQKFSDTIKILEDIECNKHKVDDEFHCLDTVIRQVLDCLTSHKDGDHIASELNEAKRLSDKKYGEIARLTSKLTLLINQLNQSNTFIGEKPSSDISNNLQSLRLRNPWLLQQKLRELPHISGVRNHAINEMQTSDLAKMRDWESTYWEKKALVQSMISDGCAEQAKMDMELQTKENQCEALKKELESRIEEKSNQERIHRDLLNKSIVNWSTLLDNLKIE